MRASGGEVVSGLGTCRGRRSRPQSHPAQRISPECQGLSFCRSRGEFGREPLGLGRCPLHPLWPFHFGHTHKASEFWPSSALSTAVVPGRHLVSPCDCRGAVLRSEGSAVGGCRWDPHRDPYGGRHGVEWEAGGCWQGLQGAHSQACWDLAGGRGPRGDPDDLTLR